MKHDPIDPGASAIPGKDRLGRPAPDIRVMDRMTQPAITIRWDASVESAWQLMRHRKVRHLPVVDGEEGLVGMVTDRDLRQVVFDPIIHEQPTDLARMLGALTVREIMSWGVITVRPETEIREAARLMHEQKIGAVPVVEGRRVVGILTESDVLQAFQDVLSEGGALSTRDRWALTFC